MPQTAEEFRKAVPGAMMAKTDSYEVNRSMKEVAATFHRRAPECLKVSVRTVSRANMSYPSTPPTGGPYVIVAATTSTTS